MDLKEIRQRLDMSQAELAAALGVHPQTVYAWESGRQEPPRYVELALRELERVKHEAPPDPAAA